MLFKFGYKVECTILFAIDILFVFEHKDLGDLVDDVHLIGFWEDLIIRCQVQLWEILCNQQYLRQTWHHSFIQNNSIGLKRQKTVWKRLCHKCLGIIQNCLLKLLLVVEATLSKSLIEQVEHIRSLAHVLGEILSVFHSHKTEVAFNVAFDWTVVLFFSLFLVGILQVNFLLVWIQWS